jgi:hypothetical protein|tara:strand:- start:4767 stop:5057 length:291 start_codon:yes stop_codon:yes gene_type:complete
MVVDHNKKSRVWIEIEIAHINDDPKKAIDHVKCEKRAELLTNMLNRLRNPEIETSDEQEISWHSKKGLYYVFHPSLGDMPLNDNGHWFNLDFYGRK